MNRLKDNALSRIKGRPFDGGEFTFPDNERNALQIKNNNFYEHGTMHVNYTTYDGRRSQDYINPRTHSDIMLVGSEDDSDDGGDDQYWYAKVLKILSVDVRYVPTAEGQNTQEYRRMHFLLVRWYGRDMDRPGSWEKKRLHAVGFVPNEPSEDGNFNPPFGFLDPDLVLRRVHLIPAFAHGKTEELLPGRSLARPKGTGDADWNVYYVNMCVQ